MKSIENVKMKSVKIFYEKGKNLLGTEKFAMV